MNLHTQITGAILGVLPGARPEARVTVEQPLQTGRDTWTGTAAGLAQRIADSMEAPGSAAPSASHDCTLPPTRRLACGHCPHEVCEDCDRCPHTCRCAVPEGKDTHQGESTPTISARDARTTVLVAIARALREQPTGARLLDGLDELGEAVVCEDLGEIAAWGDALASLAHIDDDLGITAAQPPLALTVYRAEHETIHVGHYTTETAARRHCEALVSDEHPAGRALLFTWASLGDEDDDPEEPFELAVQVDGGDEEPTGYVVVPLAVAAAYDPDAE